MKTFIHNNIEFTTFRNYNDEIKNSSFDDEYWFRIFNRNTNKIKWLLGHSLSNINHNIIPNQVILELEREYLMQIRKLKINVIQIHKS